MNANTDNGIFQWEKSKFKDIAEFLNGRAYKADEFKEFGTPIVRIQNLTGEGRTVYSDLILAEDKYIENGDLIYAWSATFGPFIWKGVKSIYHYHIWKVICNERKIDKHFFFYYLKNISDTLKDSGNGTLFVHITKALMESFEISLPPLPEQKAIAAVLSSLDDKIDLLHRQNKTLEAMAETLFRQWFVEEAREEWVLTKVKHVCIQITKGTTPTTLGKSFRDAGINFIKAESLTDYGGFLHEKFAFIDEETNELLKRSVIQKDDVLITIAGTIGRIALVPETILPANTNQAIGIIRVDKKLVSPYFIYCLLKSDDVRNDFEGRIVHAVQPNLSLGEISDIEFRMPPKENLEKGTSMLRDVFLKKEFNQIQITTLEQLRDTLLPKLMSGEVRVAV